MMAKFLLFVALISLAQIAEARTRIFGTGVVTLAHPLDTQVSQGDTVQYEVSYNESASKHFVASVGNGATYCENLELEMLFVINGHRWRGIQGDCVYEQGVGASPFPSRVISYNDFQFFVSLGSGYPDPANGGEFPEFASSSGNQNKAMTFSLSKNTFGNDFIGGNESIVTASNLLIPNIGSTSCSIWDPSFVFTRIDFELLTLGVETVPDLFQEISIVTSEVQDGQFVLDWTAAVEGDFELQQSGNLGGWSRVRDLTRGERVILSVAGGSTFYRIVEK